MKAEGDQFAHNFGRQPSGFDSYMIHQQGLAGYSSHLANPEAPAWQNMLSTGEGRQRGERWAKSAIWGNIPDQYKATFGNVDNVTSRDFINMWAAKYGGGAQPEFAPTGGINVGTPSGSPLLANRSLTWRFTAIDVPFADLRAAGVRCWFAPHHMRRGNIVHLQIDQAIREA